MRYVSFVQVVRARRCACATYTKEIAVLEVVMPLAALGYSLIYMLFGGGLFGAVVIFFVAKMLGK